MALWAAKANEDATQPLWGRASALLPSFRAARSFYVTAGSTGDLSPVLVRRASSTERCSRLRQTGRQTFLPLCQAREQPAEPLFRERKVGGGQFVPRVLNRQIDMRARLG